MIRKENPFFEKMEKPSSQARIEGPCGDMMEFSLKILKNKVLQVRCFTSGCGASRACALATAKMAQGKNLAEALMISPGRVIRTLKNIPENHLHCAILSVTTLHRAIALYLMSGKQKFRIRAKKRTDR